MSAFPMKKIAFTAAAVWLVAVGAGCSSNPPCEIDLSTVDGARSQAKASEAKLAEAKAQRAQLEKQIQQETARKAELERRKQELQKQIKELGG